MLLNYLQTKHAHKKVVTYFFNVVRTKLIQKTLTSKEKKNRTSKLMKILIREVCVWGGGGIKFMSGVQLKGTFIPK